MPRPARFDADTIIAAALRVVAARGPHRVTTEAVAAEMGGHVGSIYYRFPTKDHLLAQLWMRSARAGQTGLLTALAGDDLPVAFEEAVLHYPRWSRTDIASAQVLAAYSRDQLAPVWPDDLAAELATVNDDLARAVRTFTDRWHTTAVRAAVDTRQDAAGESSGSPSRAARAAQRQAMTFALLDLPAAAIRRYLVAGKPPPRSLDTAIYAAARAAIGPSAAAVLPGAAPGGSGG